MPDMKGPEDYFPVLILLTVVSAFVAMGIGPRRYGGRLFFSTVLIGPLSVAVALIMKAIEDHRPLPPPVPEPEPPRLIAAGRRRLTCPRCGAKSDIPDADASYDCWRCHERHAVKPRGAAQ
jgi:DNA-directed RNA polymerase subunit RPC12/RpoP